MRRRRGIMGLNGGAGIPVITATATGNPLTFETDLARPLKSLVIPFTPIQEGSGNPSPINIRPFIGRVKCEINHSGDDTSDPNTFDVEFINPSTGNLITAYGGHLTLNDDGSADLRLTYAIADLGNLSYNLNYASHGVYRSGVSEIMQNTWIYCTAYTPRSRITASQCPELPENNHICGRANTTDIYVKDTRYLNYSNNQIKAALAGVKICYRLATPRDYHLENANQIVTFLGTNAIWTDTNGTNTATYLTH